MAFEATFKHGVHPYFDQYLETATKGNVTATYAVYIDRMQLHCKACDETLTVKEPEGTTVDYGVQEFVKIHSHVGGHKAEPKCNCAVFVDAQSWRHETHCPKYAPPPKPVTVDFKPLKHVKIDEFPNVDEDKIKSQLSAYNNEVAEKLADAAIAKKIAELQKEAEQGSAGKYQIYTAPAPGIFDNKWSNSWTNEWDQYPKAKDQALKNIADLQNMMKLKILQIQEEAKVKEPEPPRVPAKEKPKPLKIATGRKFR